MKLLVENKCCYSFFRNQRLFSKLAENAT